MRTCGHSGSCGPTCIGALGQPSEEQLKRLGGTPKQACTAHCWHAQHYSSNASEICCHCGNQRTLHGPFAPGGGLGRIMWGG